MDSTAPLSHEPPLPQRTLNSRIYAKIVRNSRIHASFSRNSRKPDFSGNRGNFRRKSGKLSKIGEIVKNRGNLHKVGWKGKIQAFTQKAGQIHAFTQTAGGAPCSSIETFLKSFYFLDISEFILHVKHSYFFHCHFRKFRFRFFKSFRHFLSKFPLVKCSNDMYAKIKIASKTIHQWHRLDIL